jgi:hypothetical protein
MTPLVEAHHNSHDYQSPALQFRAHHRAARGFLASENTCARCESFPRCIVSQFGSAQRANFDQHCCRISVRAYRYAHYDRTSTRFSRFGCSNHSTTLRISASNSVDILNLSQRA